MRIDRVTNVAVGKNSDTNGIYAFVSLFACSLSLSNTALWHHFCRTKACALSYRFWGKEEPHISSFFVLWVIVPVKRSIRLSLYGNVTSYHQNFQAKINPRRMQQGFLSASKSTRIIKVGCFILWVEGGCDVPLPCKHDSVDPTSYFCLSDAQKHRRNKKYSVSTKKRFLYVLRAAFYFCRNMVSKMETLIAVLATRTHGCRFAFQKDMAR